MKRYLLFAYRDYYPNGGWNDFAGDYTTADIAEDALMIKGLDNDECWAEIIDTKIRDVVRMYSFEDGKWRLNIAAMVAHVKARRREIVKRPSVGVRLRQWLTGGVI